MTAAFNADRTNAAEAVVAAVSALSAAMNSDHGAIPLSDDKRLWVAFGTPEAICGLMSPKWTAPAEALAGDAQPVGYANGDELDNMLDDRAATIHSAQSNFHRTPLFRAAPPLPVSQDAELAEWRARAVVPVVAQDARAEWTRQELADEIAKLESVVELANKGTQMWKDRALAAPSVAVAQDAEQLHLGKRVEIAMRQAFSFGQTYWQQADSDYISQHKKSDETRNKFLALQTEIVDAVRAAPSLPAVAPQEQSIPGTMRVFADEANNYSKILSLLGMEEEGDPVAEVARLVAIEDEQCSMLEDGTIPAAPQQPEAEPTGAGPGELPGYETEFQGSVAALVMRHIDRMHDICPEDTACKIIDSFTDGFEPIFAAYMAQKFPGREPFCATASDRAQLVASELSDEQIEAGARILNENFSADDWICLTEDERYFARKTVRDILAAAKGARNA